MTAGSYFPTLLPPMFAKLCPITLVVAAATVLAALGSETVDLDPGQGVLLLRNGNILSGRIARGGDRYFVGLPDGEIRVPVEQVEMHCRDLDEAYCKKRDALVGGQLEEHLELAQWCLQHNRLGYAAEQVIAARRVAPGHPRIALIERKIELALHPPLRRPTAELAKLPTPTADLDAMVGRLPAGALETFTVDVQPLLMNRCATAACHGTTAANPLRLEHLPVGRPATRRATQRNLQSVLHCVDWDDPSASSLLTKPLSKHGPLQEAVFSRRELNQYQHLVEWVRLIAQNTAPSSAASVARTAEPLLQRIDEKQSRSPSTSPHEAAPRTGMRKTRRGQVPAPPKAKPQGNTPDRAAPVKIVPAAAPEDPFDPEIFNRQTTDQ